MSWLRGGRERRQRSRSLRRQTGWRVPILYIMREEDSEIAGALNIASRMSVLTKEQRCA